MEKLYKTIVKDIKTKTGQALYLSATAYIGQDITEVYARPSYTKVQAFKALKRSYESDPNAWNFHICNASSYTFGVAWDTIIDTGAHVVIYYTKQTKYILM